jgi:hypothetical protein
VGVPSYGFTPFLLLTPDTLHVDNVNERLALHGYRIGVDLYAGLLQRLAG